VGLDLRERGRTALVKRTLKGMMGGELWGPRVLGQKSFGLAGKNLGEEP